MEHEYQELMSKILHFSNPVLIQKIEAQLSQLEIKIRGLKESVNTSPTKRMEDKMLKEIVTIILSPAKVWQQANYHQKRKFI